MTCDRGDFRRAQSDRLLGLWDALLALGMVLSMATQLRFSTTPLGPGDVLVVVWMVPLLLLEISRVQWKVSQAFWDLMRFWMVVVLGESLGAMVTIVNTEFSDWSLVLHDIAALLLLIALSGLLTIFPAGERRLHRLQLLTVLFGGALFSMQLAQAFGVFSIDGVEPWYWERLRAWSDNPNQLALEGLVLGILSFSLAEQSTRWSVKIAAIICAGLAIVTGWLARSNAYAVVVLGAAVLWVAIKIIRRIAQFERDGIPALSLAAIPFALMMLILSMLAPSFHEESRPVTSVKSAVFRDDGSEKEEGVPLRLHLWREALNRGAKSYLLGLGPGPHLPIPLSILAGRQEGNEPTNLQHPKLEVAPNFEAHNTILEFFVQGGLLAASAFVCLCAVALWRTWQAKMDALTTLLVAVGAFGSFHVIFRHPIIWFVLSLALVARPNDRAAPLASERVLWPRLRVVPTPSR